MTPDTPTTPDEAVGVGFIGLGKIGAPMARRLLGWPGGLTVNDVAAEATAPFAEAGARVAATAAEVAEHAQVISVMVRDDAQVAEVLSGENGILSAAAPDTIVAVHSTVEAATPARLAAQAEDHGVHLVDAPVSGGWMGAEQGTLAVMLGAPDDIAERLRGPFGCFASLVAAVGPVGAGTRAKLARNLITFVSYTAVGEAVRLAAAGGVDLRLLGDVVRHSDQVTGGAGMVLLRQHDAPLPPDDGLRPLFEHARDLGEKDLWLALELAAELGLDLPMAAHALTALADALGVPPDPFGGAFDDQERS